MDRTRALAIGVLAFRPIEKECRMLPVLLAGCTKNNPTSCYHLTHQ